MITISEQTPEWEYEGKTYYFCSDTCFEAFKKDPDKHRPRIAASCCSSHAADEKHADTGPDPLALAFVENTLPFANQLVSSRQYDAAKPLFEQLLPLEMDDEEKATVLFQLGYIAMRQKQYDTTFDMWQKIIDYYPHTNRLSSALVNSCAIRFQVMDETDYADKVLTEALKGGKISETHMETANKLMYMISFEKQDYERAKGYLEQLSAASQSDSHLVMGIPIVYIRSGEKRKGDRFLKDHYGEIKDDFFKLYQLAAVFAAEDLYLDQAKNWIVRANELSGGDRFYVWDVYARILEKTGNNDEAIAALEKAIGLTSRADVRQEMEARLTQLKSPSQGGCCGGH